MEPITDLTTETPEYLLKRVYADNLPWLENYIRRYSGNESDARDIFQESVAAAWINLKEGRFKGDAAQFNAYLRQICKFKWINQLRSGGRNKIVYDDALLQAEMAADDLDIVKEQLYRAGLLQKGFAKLGEKCRQVLRLFYYRRTSLSEIANAMGNTEESIKTIKYRCMVQLRKYFLEEMKGNDTL